MEELCQFLAIKGQRFDFLRAKKDELGNHAAELSQRAQLMQKQVKLLRNEMVSINQIQA